MILGLVYKMQNCTCNLDSRTCSVHPYVHEGPNGTSRDKVSVSPNTRLKVSLGDLIKSKRS